MLWVRSVLCGVTGIENFGVCYQSGKSASGAFDGWCTLLLTDSKREDGFRRLLEAGGATVLPDKYVVFHCTVNFFICLCCCATGHRLRTIQTIVENVYVWLVGPPHHVSER